MSTALFAQIAIDPITKTSGDLLTYSVPFELQNQISIGQQVLVPLGNRQAIGFIFDLTVNKPHFLTKPILKMLSCFPLFDKNTISLAKWMENYYLSFFISALTTIMPPQHNYPAKFQQAEIQTTDYRPQTTSHRPKQNKNVQRIKGFLHEKSAAAFNHDLSFEDKTNLYLELALLTYRENKQTLIIFPEIEKVNFGLEKFAKAFGDRLSILHSGLTIKKRHQIWAQIYLDKVDLLIGSRLAVFAPLKRLGLIIINDEDDPSLKQKQNPLYNARDLALFRAEHQRIPLLLFSRTLSLESYFKSQEQSFNFISSVINKTKKPLIQIIDRSNKTDEKKFYRLSAKTSEKIKEIIAENNKVFVFTMRRGSATLVICRQCQKPLLCSNCEVSLVYHSSTNQFICHHCGLKQTKDSSCFYCQGTEFKYLGSGTEFFEENFKMQSPPFKVLRLEKERMENISNRRLNFEDFKKEADIIIGTFPMAKRLSFENSGLVVVLAIDNLLNLPDFRSSEKAFSLLWPIYLQCRKDNVDNLFIETYNPNHHVFKALEEKKSEVFFNNELAFREKLNYPPFTKLIRIVFEGNDKEKVIAFSYHLSSLLKGKFKENTINLLGPAPCFIEKKQNHYFWHLLIKGEDLEPVKKELKAFLLEKHKGVKFRVDIDPLELI